MKCGPAAFLIFKMQKISILDKKIKKNVFFVLKIWSCREKAVLLHRSPGNSSPRYDAGDESGFFIFMAKTELEILTELGWE